MVGTRSFWRTTGMKDEDSWKPIIAMINSFTQLIPGHVHLKDLGQLVVREIEAAGGVIKEFNTIAVDDGIIVGHNGMLYLLSNRDVITDSVEYMVNVHCADVMVYISSCDKVTPGVLMAAIRLNILVTFISGGPMEAGKTCLANPATKAIGVEKLDLIDAMVIAVDSKYSDEEVAKVKHSMRPTCSSCSDMLTANSMNCLTEALGLSLSGNGTVVTTRVDRGQFFKRAGRRIIELARQHYEQEDKRVLLRSASFKAFENAMTLDIAMDGLTNAILHLLAITQETKIGSTMANIDRPLRVTPQLCKVAPNTDKYHIEGVHRAGGIIAILGELNRAGKLHTDTPIVHAPTLKDALSQQDIVRTSDEAVQTFYRAGPAGIPTQVAFSRNTRWLDLGLDCTKDCIRSNEHAFSEEGDLAVLRGNIALDGCVVKTAGVDESILVFEDMVYVTESQNGAITNILADRVKAGDVMVVRREGPKGGSGMQEMLYPISYIKLKGLGKACAPLTDGRSSDGISELLIGYYSSEVAASGTIGSVRNGDKIRIDIPNRTTNVLMPDEELMRRRGERNVRGWKPAQPHPRKVPAALKAYAKLVISADKGAVRDLS